MDIRSELFKQGSKIFWRIVLKNACHQPQHPKFMMNLKNRTDILQPTNAGLLIFNNRSAHLNGQDEIQFCLQCLENEMPQDSWLFLM